jgi:hypothetical protein
MLQLNPDWLFPFAPPGWWPNHPRTFWAPTLNSVNVPALGVVIEEFIFSKQNPVLVFGAAGLVTLQDNLTEVYPPGSGAQPSTKLIRLFSPSAQIEYTNGRVPMETIIGSGEHPSIWPMPIPVRKGGSINVEIQNLHNAQIHNVRISFLCAQMSIRKVA